MNREQTRAVNAHKHITGLPDDPSMRKAYGTFCMKAPIMLKTMGPLQMLEFIRSRHKGDGAPTTTAGKAALTLLGHLAKDIGVADEKELRRKVRGAELVDYMRLTHELDAALLWYRRFAQSELKASSTDAIGDT